MDESKVEIQSNITTEVIDIRGGNCLFIWFYRDELVSFLKKGAVNPRKWNTEVWLDSNPDKQWIDPAYSVGVICRSAEVETIPDANTIRISRDTVPPEKFKGLIIVDSKGAVGPTHYLTGILSDEVKKNAHTKEVVDGLRMSCSEIGIDLPIYGTSGDMYWPRRVSHEHIVEELSRRNEVQ